MTSQSDETTVQSNAVQGALSTLRRFLVSVPGLLAGISDDDAGRKPAPGAWSPKQELGHLIDSAANNHVRLVLGQIEDTPTLQDYNGDEWVRLHSYQECRWPELIETWGVFNKQLLAAAASAPAVAWTRNCIMNGLGASNQVTLGFVLEDYVRHMIDHLRHIGINVESASEWQGSDGQAYPEKLATTDRPLVGVITRRWSPAAFEQDRQVEREKILTLLEAARWAPSCFNEQPFSYLVFDGSDPHALEAARGCLVEGNAWARRSPVLMLSVARETFAKNGAPNRHGQHDVGLASENLVLQAVELGLAAHQMAGFDAERARREFGIPQGFTPMAMIAVGYPYRGRLEDLPEKIRNREKAPRTRKRLGEIAFAGKWAAPYST